MKNANIVAAELTASLAVYMREEPEVTNEMMSEALKELSKMYLRKDQAEKIIGRKIEYYP